MMIPNEKPAKNPTRGKRRFVQFGPPPATPAVVEQQLAQKPELLQQNEPSQTKTACSSMKIAGN